MAFIKKIKGDKARRRRTITSLGRFDSAQQPGHPDNRHFEDNFDHILHAYSDGFVVPRPDRMASGLYQKYVRLYGKRFVSKIRALEPYIWDVPLCCNVRLGRTFVIATYVPDVHTAH